MKRRSNGSYSPLDDAREVSPDWVVINCKEPVPGKLYRAVFRPGPVDYWTGYVEEWEWEMVPHE